MASSGLSLSVDGDGVFERGQTVTGTVVVNRPPEDAGELTVQLVGMGHVQWVYKKGSHGDYCYPEAFESYIDVKDTLWTPSSGVPLHVGLEFPFRFELPDDLPPSTTVQGFGDIKYTIHAKLQHGSQLPTDITQTADITVAPEPSIPDKNLLRPVKIRQEQTVKTCCWTSGTMVADLTMPKKIFYPGENIVISGEVRNDSSTAIKQTLARLLRVVSCRAGSHNTKAIFVLAVVNKGPVQPGGVKKWQDVSLTVPLDVNNIPSDFGPKCTIFKIESNAVQVILDSVAAGRGHDMLASVEVQLGSISRRRNDERKESAAWDEFAPYEDEVEPVANIMEEADDED